MYSENCFLLPTGEERQGAEGLPVQRLPSADAATDFHRRELHQEDGQCQVYCVQTGETMEHG